MKVSTSSFHYNKQSRTFSAFASDICALYGRDLPQVFTLQSGKTGKELTFTHTSTENDVEGDLVLVRWINRAMNLGVVVYND